MKSLQPTTYNLQPNSGMTLVETLIYTAIVAFVVASFLVIINNILVSSAKLDKNLELSDDKQFIIQKLNWALSNVSQINAPAGGSAGGTLSINKLNFGSNPIVIDLQGGILNLKIGASSSAPLSGDGVTVSDLNFEHNSNSNETRIRATMKLANSNGTTSIDYTRIIK